MIHEKWADYSAGYPAGAALVAAGFTGIIGYIGLGSGPKLITGAVYRDAIAHGLRVLLCAELSVHDAEGGYPAGVTNAQKALADARSKGIPDSVGIAAVCDEHLTNAQISTCVDYVRGFRDVLGARTGAYGFAEFVDAVHAQGYASWWWKCGAAPTTAEAAWITFWQQNTGSIVVNKIAVDIDVQYNPVGDDMPLTAADANTVLMGNVDAHYAPGSPEAVRAIAQGAKANPDGSVDETHPFAEWFTVLCDRVTTLANRPTPVATLSADQVTSLTAAVTSAVTTAAGGLSLAVSPADVATLAKATADEFAARLAA